MTDAHPNSEPDAPRAPSELARMARMMLTNDGVRGITEADRGIVGRAQIAEVAEFSSQLLRVLKAPRPPKYLMSTIAVVASAGAMIGSLVLSAPLGVTIFFVVTTIAAYAVNWRFAREQTRRRVNFEGWFAAISDRLNQDEPLAATTTEPVTYEIAGLPAPVFIGRDIRTITEDDRVSVRSCKDRDALQALQSRLVAKARKPGADAWLVAVNARLAQLASRS